jgi:hypothetical protein
MMGEIGHSGQVTRSADGRTLIALPFIGDVIHSYYISSTKKAPTPNLLRSFKIVRDLATSRLDLLFH